MRYVIGTRGSKLALVQANYVCQRLSREYPEHEFVIQTIQTRGDRIQNVSLGEIGEKGIFVKEIEEQILSGRIDIGVHSMKDMPAVPADGLCFPGFCPASVEECKTECGISACDPEKTDGRE